MKILEELRAREIPELYLNAFLYNPNLDFNVHYDKNMVSHIANSSYKVLDYFTDPFEIGDQIRDKDGRRQGHTFIFPYISQLLNMLIENNSSFLKTALEKAIAHNVWAMEKLSSLINQFINSDFSFDDNCKIYTEFYEHGHLISFHSYYMSNRIITNIAHVTKKALKKVFFAKLVGFYTYLAAKKSDSALPLQNHSHSQITILFCLKSCHTITQQSS